MIENSQSGNTPPFSLEFEEREDYLFASVSGDEDSYDISMAYWTVVAEECIKRGTRRVLVRENLPGVISLGDMYRLAADLSRFIPGSLRVAFFDAKLEHFELNEFGGLVAQNRGANVRIVRSIEEGEEWLREG